MKWKIFVNGTKKGTIETADIIGYINQNYPDVVGNVNGIKKTVHIQVNLLEAMKFATAQTK